MKIDLSCEHTKPTTKTGQKEKCNCKYLNRNFKRELKHYFQFMSVLDKKRK